MPEPFKNQLSPDVITTMADRFQQGRREFDHSGFCRHATNNLEALELKQRSSQIIEAMTCYLPADFEHSARILHQSLAEMDSSEEAIPGTGLHSWAIMPMADYVGIHGQAHFELSMGLFEAMTQRFSAEFGIRYFLREMPAPTLATLSQWSQHSSHHVRRLVSEGTRPRLPWGMQLKDFIDEPTQTLPLLEKLKDDGSEYVRRSVANHLNDIAKDHPALVADMASRWLRQASPDRQKLVRHACRTLLKQGHPDTLAVFGYQPPNLQGVTLSLCSHRIAKGGALEFELQVTQSAQAPSKIMVDYEVHHQKANGSLSPKVFKWKDVELAPEQKGHWRRKHSFRAVTTRVYYPGLHRLQIIVNGQSVAQEDFYLLQD